jgi:hypothetical protein
MAYVADDFEAGELEQLEKGMRAADRIRLDRGQRIYRYASSTTPQEKRGASPWWFSSRELDQIHDLGIDDPTGFLGRLQFAVPFESRKDEKPTRVNHMDRLIEASVTRSTYVYAGVGLPQTERTDAGATIHYQPPENVLQLFVPSKARAQSVQLHSEIRLETDEIDDAIRNAVGKTVFLQGNPSVH